VEIQSLINGGEGKRRGREGGSRGGSKRETEQGRKKLEERNRYRIRSKDAKTHKQMQ